MKNLNHLSIAIAALFIASCSGNASTESVSESSEDTVSVVFTPADLVAKTIEYRYGEDVYHVTIDSDSTMHWEAVAGSEKGALEYETYIIESIDDSRMFITWSEANGIGVSQILDFENGLVYNHLIKGRNVSKNMGEITLLDK
ncbi:MAG: MoaF-related domain-containing protein [Cyclobacteriaceae bacterium]